MSPRKTLNYYLMKTNRLIVWILLPLMIVFILTGYGLTKPNTIRSLTGGVLNYKTALYLHTLLDVPLFFLLAIHVIIEIKFSLMRWGFENQKLQNLLILILGSICAILIIYVDQARGLASLPTQSATGSLLFLLVKLAESKARLSFGFGIRI